MKLSLYRKQRSQWLRWDYVRGNYVNISFGHPYRHAWWAFDLYLYFK